MKKTILAALACSALILPNSAEAAAAMPQPRSLSLADIVIAASGGGGSGAFDNRYFDYDILVTAVVAADLVDLLDSDTVDFTLFAPNDLAFVRLARDLGFMGFDEEGAWEYLVAALAGLADDGDPIPILKNVLFYHVLPESKNALQVIFSWELQTALEGATIRPFFIRLRDNEPDLRDPTVFFPLNVRASNGILHTVNRVLIPIDLP